MGLPIFFVRRTEASNRVSPDSVYGFIVAAKDRLEALELVKETVIRLGYERSPWWNDKGHRCKAIGGQGVELNNPRVLHMLNGEMARVGVAAAQA